ncbi:hypothetical protein ACLB2K_011761 [Fragaria x ananassa]
MIWKARNDASFRNISTSPLTIISIAASIEKSFKENNMNCRVGSFKTPSAIKWQPPPASTFKVNFDGSVTSSSAACGTIIRNSEGVPIITSSKNIGKASVPTTEASSLRDSILIAKNRGLTRIIVEGDSKIIIDAVNGKISAPWRLQQIIEDIKNLAQEFQEISFNHIYREANFAADATTSLRHSITGRRDWFQPLPRSIGRMIMFDQIGEGCPRGSFL